jgi:galactokinase
MIMEKILTEAERLFTDVFNMEPVFISKAPGRINIIGEHTDYNFGLSMPCAINRWILVSFSPRNDKRIHIISYDFNEQLEISLDEPYTPDSDWKKYVYGCIQIASILKKTEHGFNAFIQGDVPVGSGVSSSAALEVAFMNGLNELYNLQLDKLAIIKLCQRVEHEFLHVKSGLLDQYASQFSKANNFLVLDFRDMSHRYISAALENYCWVLCNSMVARTLAGSKYTERVEETQQALKELKILFPEIRYFRDIQEAHIPALKNLILQKRIKHYVLENKRVEDAILALQKNDLTRFGALLSASHISLRDLYEVSCPETDFLMEQAVLFPYCLGSRIMGGGFGGCTINLVEKDKAEEFSTHIKSVYKKQFNRNAEINEYHSVDGASIILV